MERSYGDQVNQPQIDSGESVSIASDLTIDSDYQNHGAEDEADYCPIKLIPVRGNLHTFGGLVKLREGRIIRIQKFSRIRKIIGTMSRTKERLKSKPEDYFSLKGMLRPKENPHFLLTLDERCREKIWRMLDERSKKVVRLVNSVFRREIDVSAGLEVVVNDELEGNLEFIQSVEVTEACLLHLKSSFFRENKQLFRCNWNIETIDSWMQLNVITFRHLVLDLSQTLECIYFREMAFIRKYISSSRADESNCYSFPRLTTILLYYGYFDSPSQNFRIFNSNMKYILSTWDCPRLQNFQVLPEPTVNDELVNERRTILHKNCSWESHALKKFISKHRSTLRKLKLVLYRRHLSPEHETYNPPTQLVEYIVLFPMLEAIHARNIQNFWRDITQSQTECQVMSSQAELWGDIGSMNRALRKNIFVFSASSLTKIFLESYHRKKAGEAELTHTLDLKQFKSFHGLTELQLNVNQIGKQKDSFYALNLSSLPRKIQILIIEGFRCLTCELMYITELPKLLRVSVKGCGTEGIYGVNYEVARAFLSHDNIKMVSFGGLNDTNNASLLYTLIKKFNKGKFDQEFDVVSRRDSVSCFDRFPRCCCIKSPEE